MEQETSKQNPESNQSIDSIHVGKNTLFGGVVLGLLSVAIISDLLAIQFSIFNTQFSIQVGDIGSNVFATTFYISVTILASDGLVLLLEKSLNDSLGYGILSGILLLIYTTAYTFLEEAGILSGLIIVGFLMWKYSDTTPLIDHNSIKKSSRFIGFILFIVGVILTISAGIILIYINL